MQYVGKPSTTVLYALMKACLQVVGFPPAGDNWGFAGIVAQPAMVKDPAESEVMVTVRRSLGHA